VKAVPRPYIYILSDADQKIKRKVVKSLSRTRNRDAEAEKGRGPQADERNRVKDGKCGQRFLQSLLFAGAVRPCEGRQGVWKGEGSGREPGAVRMALRLPAQVYFFLLRVLTPSIRPSRMAS